MAGVVFQAEPDLSFTAGLARWLSQPNEPLIKPAEEVAEGEEPPAPPPCSAFESGFVALEAKGEFEKVSAQLRAKLTELFADTDEAALQSAYAIYFQLLVQWELLASSVEGLADELAAKPDDRPALRRLLLVSLYALVQQFGLAEPRFAVLVRLITFASAAGQLDEVFGKKEGRVASMERWTREWELGDAQKKQLWGLFFDAHKDDTTVIYGYALKYLSLFSGEELSGDAQLHARLVSSLLLSIRSPTLYQSDELASLPVTKQLGKEADFASLYRLVCIFARESFAEYTTFQSSADGAACMKSHGLLHDDCARKMRLLTLVSLGQATKDLPYATIAAALKVDEADVERWAMDAIGAGLISAKMDQVERIVYISLTVEREFGPAQWHTLHASLGDWRDSIRGLLSVIQGSRPQPIS